MGYEGKKHYKEESVSSLRLQYKLIQAIKYIRSDAATDLDESFDDDFILCDRSKTLEDMYESIIQKRCDEMRPEHTYKEIAQSLGITKRTLWKRRKKHDVHRPKS